MRKERYPQTQNRMYFKEHDHREIIMDDQYHGAVYVDDEVEPAWRKYKPRLITYYFTGGSNSYDALMISADIKNKYFSKISNSYFSNYAVYQCGEKLYSNYQAGSTKKYALVTTNGYDWKKKQVSSLYNPGTYLGPYGDKYAYISNSGYKLISFDYNYGDLDFGELEVAAQASGSVSNMNYIGQINNDTYKGALFFTYSAYKTTIYLVTGTDFSVQEIFSYTGSATNRFANSTPSIQMFYVNNTYIILLPQIILSRAPTATNGTYLMYHKLVMLASPTGAPESWTETTVIPQYLSIDVRDNESNRVYYYHQNNNFTTATNGRMRIFDIIYSDSKYYIYVYKWESYTSYQDYTKRGNQKIITKPETVPVHYGKIVALCSDDLENWTEYSLPDYVDISFYNDSDILDGRHGIGIAQPIGYSSVRFFFNGRNLRSSTPSGILPSEQYFWDMTDFAPCFFGNNLNDINYLPTIETINSRIGFPLNEDINLMRGISLYESDMVTLKFKGYIFANFKDPLFQNNSDSYVYLLSNTDGDYCIKPDMSQGNVDPISEEDYIFDT